MCLLSSVRTIPGWTAYAVTPVSVDKMYDRSNITPKFALLPFNFPIYLIFRIFNEHLPLSFLAKERVKRMLANLL